MTWVTIKAKYCEVCAAREEERNRKAEEILKTLPIEEQMKIRLEQLRLLKSLFVPYEPYTLGLFEERDE